MHIKPLQSWRVLLRDDRGRTRPASNANPSATAATGPSSHAVCLRNCGRRGHMRAGWSGNARRYTIRLQAEVPQGAVSRGVRGSGATLHDNFVTCHHDVCRPVKPRGDAGRRGRCMYLKQNPFWFPRGGACRIRGSTRARLVRCCVHSLTRTEHLI